MKKIAGSDGPYVTGKTDTASDKTSSVVEVEGRLGDLRSAEPSSFCPDGMVVESSTVSPTGGGMGRLSIRCVNYGQGDISTTPTRTTWRIMMSEVQTQLKSHPHFDGSNGGNPRIEIEKWLATDEGKRYDEQGNPQYVDSEGNAHLLTSPATDFCTAYEKGIETYVRHFPVIEKISYYKTLPGCSMTENSTTSGTVSQFSSDIDTWDVPDVTLSGYANTGWLKSGDTYEQGDDLVWTRHEQWTWSPDGSSSSVGWIYGSQSQD